MCEVGVICIFSCNYDSYMSGRKSWMAVDSENQFKPSRRPAYKRIGLVLVWRCFGTFGRDYKLREASTSYRFPCQGVNTCSL